MDNEEFTGWLSAVFTQLNRALKLMPAVAWERDINMFLAQYGGERLLQVVNTLGVPETEQIQLMVEQYPDLGNQLANEETQEAIRSWISTSQFAPKLKTLRLMAAWLAPPDEKTGDSQLEWQIEGIPDNGAIYRTLLRGGTDEKGICNN